MKLLYCEFCNDVFSLRKEPSSCHCGACSGHYEENFSVVATENAVILGFDWKHFKYAISNRPIKGLGKIFKAFIVPHECSTVRYMAKNYYENKYFSEQGVEDYTEERDGGGDDNDPN